MTGGGGLLEPPLGPLGSLLNQLHGLSQLGPVGSMPLSWGIWGPAFAVLVSHTYARTVSHEGVI